MTFVIHESPFKLKLQSSLLQISVKHETINVNNQTRTTNSTKEHKST